jgi:hypothetical protein
MPMQQDTEIFISGFTGIQNVVRVTASAEFNQDSILDWFYASYSTFTLTVGKGHSLKPGNVYRLRIELYNEGEEQEAPVLHTYSSHVYVESPSSSEPIQYQLPKLRFDVVQSDYAFGVANGQRPMKLVQPAFLGTGGGWRKGWLLGPFYMTSPIASGRNTSIQLVIQTNVRLLTSSCIMFQGFRGINPVSGMAQVTCYTSSAFAKEAKWNPEDRSFRVDLVDSMEAHTVYTLQLDFIQVRGTPGDLERETTIDVSAQVEAGEQDSMIAATPAKILIDLGNLPPSFQLESSVLMVLEDSTGLFF